MKQFSINKIAYFSLLSIVLVTIISCKSSNLEIVRLPFIVPVVIPDLNNPHNFLLTVAVQNNGNAKSDPVQLALDTYYSCPEGSTSINPGTIFEIPALTAGQGWNVIKDYPISKSQDNGEGHSGPLCDCIQDVCSGYLNLNLLGAHGDMSGPNTNLKITWDKSGDLKLMKIEDISK